MTVRLQHFHAASGLLFVITMIAGWFLAAANGMPDLSSADKVFQAYRHQGHLLPTTMFVMTIGFFFSLWFTGVVLGRIHQAEGAGPLTWIAVGGAFTFIGVFMAGLAMGLANSLAITDGQGADAASIYVAHLASLLTGPTTGMCGAAFFIPLAIVIFNKAIFPRWLGWLSVAAALGSMTPMAGFWSLTGPLNVGNGLIGVHTIAGTWGVFAAMFSLQMLRELRAAAREAAHVRPPVAP
ncbi:MAG TPA: hypothetical protein VJT31_06860 [Rugosimonospora sp.]|nr:hypothetical protein [Rugosimonospora sp.]